MAQIVELPRRAVATTAAAVTTPFKPLLPDHSVDEWGRDGHLVRLLWPLARLRWNVSLGGLDHLPARAGALLVTNERRWSSSPLYVAGALSHATGRPVRFVGRPDHAPFGAALRRVGAILDDPTEVHGALRHGELVVMGAEATTHPRHAGAVDHELVGAAVTPFGPNVSPYLPPPLPVTCHPERSSVPATAPAANSVMTFGCGRSSARGLSATVSASGSVTVPATDTEEAPAAV